MAIIAVANKSITVSSTLIWLYLTLSMSASASVEASQQLNMEQWLKARFGAQHEKLIPIVAVADMYFSCQQQKQADSNLTIKALITKVDRNVLAEKLMQCLAGESPKSDIALNYGLMGCFHEQLSSLSAEDRAQKMDLVTKAIASLSRAERQKSFSQCVTEQSISYLK